jgi:hypothetical protein
MLKKLFIIVLILVLIAAIAIIGYIYYTYIAPEDRPNIINSALDYFPFGRPSGDGDPLQPTGNGSQQNVNEQPNVLPVVIPALRKVTGDPVAGAGTITRVIEITNEDGTKTKKTEVSVRYIERGTGHISEMATESNKLEKLSNTTVPKIYDAYFANQAAALVFRYANDAETIQTYGARIISATSTAGTSTVAVTEYKLDGGFLPPNITDLSLSPTKDRIAYVEQQGSGARVVISGFTGTGRTEVFQSQLREWLIQWPQATSILLTTKPSAETGGLLFRINTQTGAQTIALGPINGLTALSNPTGTYILYTQSTTGGFRLNLLDTKTNTSRVLSQTTLPVEKCVWSTKDEAVVYCAVPTQIPSTSYPDAWYMGHVSFSDVIMKIDVASSLVQTLARPQEELREAVDGISLVLDADERYLFFRNKKDSALWQLRLVPVEQAN